MVSMELATGLLVPIRAYEALLSCSCPTQVQYSSPVESLKYSFLGFGSQTFVATVADISGDGPPTATLPMLTISL